jgi:hypothetical protein
VELVVGVDWLEVVVGVAGVLVAVEEVVDVTVGVDVLVTAGVLVVWWQSLLASSATVEAPWIRLLRSVGFTDAGRPETESLSAFTAFAAPEQLPAASAEETRFSWFESVLD